MDDARIAAAKIVALRNEKGSYNDACTRYRGISIVALRNEKGSYNTSGKGKPKGFIVALRNEKGSYNIINACSATDSYCSTAK